MNILCKKLSIAGIFMGFTLATASLSWANSHREAPMIGLDAETNQTDVYVFGSNLDDDSTKDEWGVIQNQNPAMVVSDVDGDNIADIVISTQYRVSVLLGNGDGSFYDQVVTQLVPPATGKCWSMKGGVGLVVKNISTKQECQDPPLRGKSWCEFGGSCEDLPSS